MPPAIEWRLSEEAARQYEEALVPNIMGPFAHALVTWAAIRPGQWVLDVGCGTGAASRAAAEQVGHFGRVVGLDKSQALLEVARTAPTQGKTIEWQEGDAARIPLPSRIFDIVLFAHTLQFLPDQPAALAEAQRVLRPGGRVVFSAWCGPSDSPYLGALQTALNNHLGEAAAVYFQAAFNLADRAAIEAIIGAARFQNLLITVNRLDFRLPELSEFIPQHLRATPPGESFNSASQATRQAIIAEVQRALADRLSETPGWIPFQSFFVQAQKIG